MPAFGPASSDEARVVEAVARWVERGTGCAALERIKIGPRNAIARKIRELFGKEIVRSS